jgi:hypothetical protein
MRGLHRNSNSLEPECIHLALLIENYPPKQGMLRWGARRPSSPAIVIIFYMPRIRCTSFRSENFPYKWLRAQEKSE